MSKCVYNFSRFYAKQTQIFTYCELQQIHKPRPHIHHGNMQFNIFKNFKEFSGMSKQNY